MFALRYKKLGGKIAYYRKLKNLTQVELATLVGISIWEKLNVAQNKAHRFQYIGK